MQCAPVKQVDQESLSQSRISGQVTRSVRMGCCVIRKADQQLYPVAVVEAPAGYPVRAWVLAWALAWAWVHPPPSAYTVEKAK